MKHILNLFVALFALLVLAAPVQAGQVPEEFEYQSNGEKCTIARADQDLYVENGEALPKDLRKTLEKCNKYAKKASAQKRPPTKTSILGFW